jgi:hypothetical protein
MYDIVVVVLQSYGGWEKDVLHDSRIMCREEDNRGHGVRFRYCSTLHFHKTNIIVCHSLNAIQYNKHFEFIVHIFVFGFSP